MAHRRSASPAIIAAVLLYLALLAVVLVSSIGILTTDFTPIRAWHYMEATSE